MRPSADREREMRKSMSGILGLAFIILVFVMLASCVLVPGRHRRGGVVIVPPLPSIVVLEEEPYYYQSGYYYYYNNDHWYYSNNRGGPWKDLPRKHYPKDIRYKGRHDNKGKGWKHGREEDRY